MVGIWHGETAAAAPFAQYISDFSAPLGTNMANGLKCNCLSRGSLLLDMKLHEKSDAILW